jgi:phage terminase small subunit
MLTQKQEIYCLKYIEYGSAAAAYKSAYDAENMKANTVYRKATELNNNGNVTARIYDLRTKLANRILWSKEESIRLLARIAQDETLRARDRINAIKELNSVLGLNIKSNS